MTVRPTVMDDFKTLVRQQGMSEDTIIVKQNKGKSDDATDIVVIARLTMHVFSFPVCSGDCVPGQQVAEETTQPEPQVRYSHCWGARAENLMLKHLQCNMSHCQSLWNKDLHEIRWCQLRQSNSFYYSKWMKWKIISGWLCVSHSEWGEMWCLLWLLQMWRVLVMTHHFSTAPVGDLLTQLWHMNENAWMDFPLDVDRENPSPFLVSL